MHPQPFDRQSVSPCMDLTLRVYRRHCACLCGLEKLIAVRLCGVAIEIKILFGKERFETGGASTFE